ncbi:preprotein translocase subunit SecG [Buchnera aphidicola]|uniref:preprotein translocase subunit SecG n=1 Tax=Buchnera aphidicola TaxID=9 RepID=UPI0034647F62
MRVFFVSIHLFFSIMLIILILLQKNQGSTDVSMNSMKKNVFNVSTKSEFLNRMTIICAGIFLVLSVIQCSISHFFFK